MSLVEVTEFGRIYVRSCQIEKYVYNLINDVYPQVDCYALYFRDNNIDIKIKEQRDLDIKDVYKFQDDIKTSLNKNLGVYVANINIIFG